jgi:KaiC/GvpD/RAD55 family RecA-like ATPase
MQFNSNYEKLFFIFCLKQPKYLSIIGDGFFTNPDIDILAFLAKKFYEKFSESPTSSQMKLLVQNSKKAKDKVTENIIDTVYDVNLSDYDEDWLETTAESWIKWRNFDKSLIDGIEYVKTANVTPDNVESIISKFREVINDRNKINFDKDLGLDFFNPDDHVQHTSDKISSGYSFIDRVTNGGYDPCSLIVYAGEQNVGKSIWLANDAANYVRLGYNTAFVTAEMAGHKVIKRVGANLLNISMSEYDTKSKDIVFMKRRLENVGDGLLPPGRLFVKKFPTSQASVPDLENYLLDLEETTGVKLRAVVIDYINILSNYRNANSENTYMKIKQIAEDLRAMADRNKWLIVTATQIKRGAYNSTDIGMEDISESAGLAHTADMIYAIIQDELMHSEFEYWLKILKIRDGEGKNLKCKFNINYDYMRLNETNETSSSGIN